MGDIKEMGAVTAEHFKHTVDAGAITITVGALVELLPAVASLLSIFWMIIRIYETKTIQRLLGKRSAITVDEQEN